MANDLGGFFGGVGDFLGGVANSIFDTSNAGDVVPYVAPTAIQTVQQGVSMSCGTGHPKRVLGYLDSQGNFCKKKSRRRRQRLATKADIKDLASLKGVLGGGKAFETWISTH